MCGVREMPPIRPARGRTRRGGALAVIALAAIGCLAPGAPSAQAQTEHTTQNRFGNAPAISTICHFNRGPRSGTKLDYAQMGYRPLPVARPYSGTAPAGGGVVPPAYAPAAPGPVYAPPPRPVTFAAGGSVRKAVVTPANPLPQPGFGLYVYILPEREVDSSILRGIEEFHRCLDPAGVGEAPRTIALMILPTRGPAALQVDPALSHDLVRTAIADDQIDPREVYVAATNAPLVRGVRADLQAVTVITLGR